ncbi:unnamed protein product [Nippostrongylus brasiliensis]|uniref:CHM2A protein n=1 Tax=Nippostrongylus brasiliensis TaxID=27835 RepID=A0A0N4XUI3_NIPBR|nr:unnamed protein product [Nippostrongylus brasiliensis]
MEDQDSQETTEIQEALDSQEATATPDPMEMLAAQEAATIAHLLALLQDIKLV